MSAEVLYPEDTIVRVDLTEQELDASGNWATLPSPPPRTDGLVRYALSETGAAIGDLEEPLVNISGTRVYQAEFQGTAIAAAMAAASVSHGAKFFRIATFGTDAAPLVTPMIYKRYRTG